MSNETLTKEFEEALFETPVLIDEGAINSLGRIGYRRPKIDAYGIDDYGLEFYEDLIGRRTYGLPEYFGEVSSRLGGYKGKLEDLLTNSVYTIRPEESGVGGMYNPETKETALNADLLYSDPRFARHAVTHEMVHQIQDFSGAISMYENVLARKYRDLFGKEGGRLEQLGIQYQGARRFMEELGERYGLERARACVEGGASATTGMYEGEPTHDAYEKVGWTGGMLNAIKELGYGVVLAPINEYEVRAVDSYLDNSNWLYDLN